MTDNRTEVQELNEAFYKAFANRDIQDMSKVWFQGETSLCIHPGGNILRGWEDIRKSWEQIFRNTSLMRIDIEVVSAEVGSQIACIVVVENVLQETRGRRMKALSLATNTFEKMAQKWYLIHHHGSPVMR